MTATNPSPQACLLVLPWSLRHLGGVNEVVKSLIRSLASGGQWQPLLLVVASPEAKTEALCPVSYGDFIPPVEGKFRWYAATSFVAHLPRRLFQAWRLIRNYNVRIVNAHYPHLGLLHFSLLRVFGLFKGALILSFHLGDAKGASRASGVERWLWRLLLRSADRLVTPSRDLQPDLLAVDPDCGKKLVAIPNGVDVEFCSSRPLELDRFPLEIVARPVILSIGNFEERKGHQTLMRAVRRVRQHIPDAALVIVGATFPYYLELRRLRTELELENDVFFIPDVPHDKIPAYLSRVRVFALATRSESFCLAILEAGAAGLPVVSTRAPGVVEIVEDGITARLAQVDDDEALAGHIVDLLLNPEEASRLAGNLRQHIEKNLTWTHHYENYRRLYDSVVSEQAGG